jgi:putative intracellular protease/amidase
VLSNRLGVLACAAALLGAFSIAAAKGPAANAAKPSLIRVAYFDVGETDAAAERGAKAGSVGLNVKRCLDESTDFTFKVVTAEDIRAGALAKFDVLLCPGGSGSKQAEILGADGRQAIRDFVRKGGGYVGICAGSYLATTNYTWSLGILNASVVDRAHWARGTGNVTLKLTDEGKRILGASDKTVTCYYGQGPLLAPGKTGDYEQQTGEVPAYHALATYNSEIAKEGVPKGVMVGTTAIATGDYGKGRVICFSPHPEKTKGLSGFIRAGVRWAAGKE